MYCARCLILCGFRDVSCVTLSRWCDMYEVTWDMWSDVWLGNNKSDSVYAGDYLKIIIKVNVRENIRGRDTQTTIVIITMTWHDITPHHITSHHIISHWQEGRWWGDWWRGAREQSHWTWHACSLPLPAVDPADITATRVNIKELIQIWTSMTALKTNWKQQRQRALALLIVRGLNTCSNDFHALFWIITTKHKSCDWLEWVVDAHTLRRRAKRGAWGFNVSGWVLYTANSTYAMASRMLTRGSRSLCSSFSAYICGHNGGSGWMVHEDHELCGIRVKWLNQTILTDTHTHSSWLITSTDVVSATWCDGMSLTTPSPSASSVSPACSSR